MAVQIYAFYHLEGDQKRFFYVGRSKDLQRRMREHNRNKRKGHEDKYERIRHFESAGISWFSEAIETVTDNEYFPDAERWHVIRLTREGHELMNMRHGSVEHIRVLADQIRARYIRNAADVRADRRRRKFQKSKMLRRRIWIRDLKHGIPDMAADKMLPRVFHRKILALVEARGRTNVKYERGLDLEEFIMSIRRPLSKEREFRDFTERVMRIPLPTEARQR